MGKLICNNNQEAPLVPTFKAEPKFSDYLKKSKPTQLLVINFTTSWCKPCKNAEKPFEELAVNYKDVRFANVDVDYLMKIAEDLEIKMMPTFSLVKVIKKRPGQRDKKLQETSQEQKKEEQKKFELLHGKYEIEKLDDDVVGYDEAKRKVLDRKIKDFKDFDKKNTTAISNTENLAN